VNFLLYTKSLSRKENLTENLCVCYFLFGDQPTRRRPPAVGSDFVCAVHLPALQTAIEAL
jgi:hypothetical protein